MNSQDQQAETVPDPDSQEDADPLTERRAWRLPAHRIRVCRMDTCEADGGGELTQVLEQRLGIRLDERTADGSVSLEGLECIGLCGIGRAALIDDMPVLGQDSILRAVDDLSR